jgi:hypothetical protein
VGISPMSWPALNFLKPATKLVPRRLRVGRRIAKVAHEANQLRDQRLLVFHDTYVAGLKPLGCCVLRASRRNIGGTGIH